MNRAKKNQFRSLFALLIIVIFFLIAHFYFYPKWQKTGTEATIGWDVSGYYMYLPATFIYKDLKGIEFKDEILDKYKPTPDLQQAYQHSNGNYVMKYSMGQAIHYLPFFVIAHIQASRSSRYEADGFSLPYQFWISMSALFYAFLGLCLLRSILLEYFDDHIVAITLVAVALGSNYLNYSAIDGAMTHNTLFFLYALLVYVTIRWYRYTNYRYAIAIGLVLGLAALTRPTEIIACIIPIMWGLKLGSEHLSERLDFFSKHKYLLLVSVLTMISVGALQLIYWKYVTGDWIVYSYQDQGFSWLQPHLIDGLFSYRSGWLTYSPILVFSLVGFTLLYRKKSSLFLSSFSFCMIFIYLVFAWDIWWYGGALGQRAMVQSYPLFAFPMAAFFARIWQRGFLIKTVIALTTALFIYYNIWLTYQAHLGGMLHAGQMNKAYFWKVLGKLEKDDLDLKLLDNPEYVKGERVDIIKIPPTYNGATMDTTICINDEISSTAFNGYYLDLTGVHSEWIRAEALFQAYQKEWNVWDMPLFMIQFWKDGDKVKKNTIRLHRHLQDGELERHFIDAKMPKDGASHAIINIVNEKSDKKLCYRELVVEAFNTE